MDELSCTFKVFRFSVEVAARSLIKKGKKARLKSFALRCGTVEISDLKESLKIIVDTFCSYERIYFLLLQGLLAFLVQSLLC